MSQAQRTINIFAIGNNLGDMASSPANYFDFGTGESPTISHFYEPTEVESDLLVLGGGGIFVDHRSVARWLELNGNSRMVTWGTGRNIHWNHRNKHWWKDEYHGLERFDLAGIRDFPPG